MSKDPNEVRPRVLAAVDAIGSHLALSRSVAFVTEGDPSVFSTFGYVRQEASRRWPDLRIEVVPGVTSITAVAGLGQGALAAGRQRMAIRPRPPRGAAVADSFRRSPTGAALKPSRGRS